MNEFQKIIFFVNGYTLGCKAFEEYWTEKGNQFWVPAGFGHAFLALEDDTIFCYKCTEVYAPNHQVSIRWDDSDIRLDIPVENVDVSEKDQNALYLIEYIQQLKQISAIV